MFQAVSILALIVSSLVAKGNACVVPTGINDGGGIEFSSLTFPPPPAGIFGTCIGTAVPTLGEYETPIQMRMTLAAVTGVYGAASAFEENALEWLGRVDVSEDRRRCANSPWFQEHRAVTLAYAVMWHMVQFVPNSKDNLLAEALSWNLDLNICDTQDCSDISTPWGLARAMLEEATEIFAVDGWNADGSLSSTFNRVPFSDWRSNQYQPLSDKKKESREHWSPLQETDGLGFMFRQEHVTSHIGETARSFFLGDDDICGRELDNPKYDYALEAQLVLDRSAALTEVAKAEVEFFDSKLASIVPLQVQYHIRSTGGSLDSWEFVLTDTIAISAIYEAIIVSWKEKVRHDRVRPTTWIHENLGQQTVVSYQGPSEGTTGPLPADEWQPYIRVMPHAEYPSGSSCLCAAFAIAQRTHTGIDDVTTELGGPLLETIPAGSSRYEANQPANDIVLSYNSWSEVAAKCGESRLNGGMHFTAAVSDGETLCGDIGLKVVEYYHDLAAGVTPANAVSFEEALTVPSESRGCGREKGGREKGGREKGGREKGGGK